MLDNNLTLSVVIPLYNKEKYIKRSLVSVLAQTFDNFEVVVVDDGSTDGSVEVVKDIDDERVRLISQPNSGVSAARNTGIRAARGSWVAFLDADDQWNPEKLQLQMDWLNKYPDVVWASGGFIREREGVVVAHEKAFSDNWFESEGLVQDALVPMSQGGYLWTTNMVIQKKILTDLGGFNCDLVTGEDIDLWLRIAVQYSRLVYVQKAISVYHTNIAGSLTVLDAQKGGNDSCRLLIQNVLAYRQQVNEIRQKLLDMIAMKILITRVECLLSEGRNKHAREVLDEFPIEGISCRIRLKTFVPGRLWKFYSGSLKRIKNMIRQLTNSLKG